MSFASAAFLLFLIGFATAFYQWWPHALLAPPLEEVRRLVAGGNIHRHHRNPARHDLAGVRAYRADGSPVPLDELDADQDVVLLTSYWPEHGWRPGVRIIDRRGVVLHDRMVDIMAIWPRYPHDPGTKAFHDPENYVHGTYLFPNGDVLLNVEYLGLARLDPEGNTVWRLDRQTHHSIQRDDDGNFWVCEMRWITDLGEALRRFLGLIPPFAEDRVIKVSPDGEVLAEISVLEIVFASPFRSLLWRHGPDPLTRKFDPLHLNDVEPLPAAVADRYPTLAAGDLLVSLCYLNLVFVFDPVTRAIKWSQMIPLVRQHDPDFLGDGWIGVFNNNTDGTGDGMLLGGSTLVAFEPHSGATRQIYPVPGAAQEHERHFFTPIGGKAQLLPDGHWLITEAVPGRVFEIDRRGRTVWEWGQQRHADGKLVSEVLEGTSYPYTPAQVRAWKRR